MARTPRFFRSLRSPSNRPTSASSAARSARPWMAAAILASAVAGRPLTAGAAPTPQAPRRDAAPAAPTLVLPHAPLSDQLRAFAIPPGPLDAALEMFQTATGIIVVVEPARLVPFTSPGVIGTLTIEQALLQILSASPLTVRFTGPQTVTLDVAVAEFVSVEGQRARRSAHPVLTEPLRDIPQTIAVIPAALIEEQGASSLRDVLRNVVGITFQAGEGGVPAGDQMTIRGFSARTDLFVDGVRDVGGYSRDPFNVEQVEVAKGPSSAIAGRGSTGGALNLVSKTPHTGASYDLTLGGGSADYKRSTVDVNQPVPDVGIPGTALRLNAMWTDSGVAGRDAVRGARWGLAPSIAFGLGTPTQVTASYSRLRQDNLPEYGLPWVPANTNPELAEYANGIPPVDQRNFYGLRTRDYEDTTTDLASLQVDHAFSSRVSMRHLTRYGTTSRDSVITAPRFASVNTSTMLNRQLQSRDMVDDIVAHQTTLTTRVTTGTTGHAIVGGLEWSAERSQNFLRTGPAAPQADLFHPNANDPYPGPITRTGARNTGEARSTAVYLFDTASFGDRLELTGGLRWDRFDVGYESLAATGVVTALDRVDDVLSWRAGAVFKPRSLGSVYAGVGSAFNPSAEGLTLSAATAALAPERTRSYEVGTKWDLAAERLAITGAAFRIDKTNARTPGVNAGDPPTVLAGRQSIQGIELSLSGRLSASWTAFGAYSFMASDIEASNTAAEVDNALALTPRHTFSLWMTMRLPWDVTVGGGAQYMDAVFRNATNTAFVPSYWLVNGVAAYGVNEHLTLRLNINNLLNEVYVDRIGGGHYIPGATRSVQLSTSLRF